MTSNKTHTTHAQNTTKRQQFLIIIKLVVKDLPSKEGNDVDDLQDTDVGLFALF